MTDPYKYRDYPEDETLYFKSTLVRYDEPNRNYDILVSNQVDITCSGILMEEVGRLPKPWIVSISCSGALNENRNEIR